MTISWLPSERRARVALLALVFLLPSAFADATQKSRTGEVAPSGALFYPVTPCRLLDTRNPNGPLGGPPLQPGVARTFNLPPTCGIPAGAAAISVNATVTNTTGPGQVVLFPGDIAAPGTSNLSFGARQTRAVAVLVPLAADGTIKVLATGAAADFILDVGGYFYSDTTGAPLVTLDPVPSQTIPTNTTLSLRLSGHSTDASSVLMYGLVAGPPGASVTAAGIFVFTPAPGQLGPQNVTVRVQDLFGRGAQTSFGISVVDHDHGPALGPLPDDVTSVGASYTKGLTATDPDAGDTLTFTLLSGPAGMTLTGSTLAWTPTAGQLGSWPVGVRVTDRAGLSASGLFHVGVPFLTAKDDAYSVRLGETLTIPAPGVLANDVDPLGGVLTAAKLSDPDKGSLTSFAAGGGFTYQAPASLPPPAWSFTRKFNARPGAAPYKMPLVIDLNGDGFPDVISANVGLNNEIYAVSGKDGSILWDTTSTAQATGCWMLLAGLGWAAGDIDDSGHPSLVFPVDCQRDSVDGVSGVASRYMALKSDGTLKWLSPPLAVLLPGDTEPQSNVRNTWPTISRLSAFGPPRIVFGFDPGDCSRAIAGSSGECRAAYALSGDDGSIVQTFKSDPAPQFGFSDHGALGFTAPIVADLDGDGQYEVVYAGAVFNADGTVKWQQTQASVEWIGIANFDDSPDIEIASLEYNPQAASPYRLAVRKANGTMLWFQGIPQTSVYGEPVIGDTDGDGKPNIVLNVERELWVFNHKGELQIKKSLGTYPNGDRRADQKTRFAVFDLNGDGIPEILLSQTDKLTLLRGDNGEVEAEDVFSAPGDPNTAQFIAIADTDGDGHADVVIQRSPVCDFVSCTGGGVDVVSATANDWQPAGRQFNQRSWFPGGFGDDGKAALKFANVFTAPQTNVFASPPRVGVPVDPRQSTRTSFTYAASDGPLTSPPGTVTIGIQPQNSPPRFVSVPPKFYVPQSQGYTARAIDPDPGDSITYAVVFQAGNNPHNASIDPVSGVMTIGGLLVGDQILIISATDTQGAVTFQEISMAQATGLATMPNVVGQPQAAAASALAAAFLSVGNVSHADDSSPAGTVLAQAPLAGVSLPRGEAVALLVSNGPPLPPPLGPPPSLGNIKRIVVTPAATARVVGETLPYKAIATYTDNTSADVSGVATWASSSPGVASVDTAGLARAVGPGSTLVTAAAGGLSGQASLSVAARVPLDNVPPVAAITQPASGGTVSGLTQILGTATDSNFLRYEIALAAAGDATFTVVGQGAAQVTTGVLGTLDPTLLLNGPYTLRLTVLDANGNSAAAEVPVVVDGGQKVGNFTLSYTDLTVPLAGIPIQITRMYDSRDRRTGDFGAGWSLGVKAVRVGASGILGAAWQVVKQGLSYVLVPGSDHFVSVTLPSGRVETYDLRVGPTVSPFVPLTSLQASFVPRPGALGSLQSLDNTNLLIADPEPGPITLVDDTTLSTFHPDRFLYTQIDGAQFVVTRTHGVESVKDTNGNQITITSGGISHSSGLSVVFTRDGSGRITAITDPKGQAHGYTYSAAGDLASHVDAAGGTTSYFYNAQHGLVRIQDPLGRAGLRTDYDDQGRLLSITNATGGTTKYTHDLPGRQEQVEDVLGRISLFNYDDRGNVLSVTDALGGTTVSTYDSLDNETSRVDPDGRRTATTYSGALPMSSVVDPGGLNLTTSNAYNGQNDPVSITDAAGRVFSLAYDGNRNLTQLNTPLSGTVTAVVNGQGLPVSVADALGSTTISTRDVDGRLTREDVRDVSSTLLRRTEFTWDANGNKLTETLYRTVSGVVTPLTTSYAYDAAGRNVSVTGPAGGVQHHEYDAANQETAVVDELGRRTTFTYDDAGRKTLTTYPDGTSEATGYDTAGNVVSRSDRAGRTTTYAYDALNRQIRTTLPDGTFTQTVYSPGGLVAATIDAKGSRTDYSYDAAGRRTGTLLPPVLSGVSGPLTRPQLSTVLNSLGVPTSATDANGRLTSFQYDSSGHPAQTTFADGSTMAQTFDVLGRRTAITNEEGQARQFAYDALGRLVAVSGVGGDATYAYDEAGNLVTQTDALGRSTHLRYDALNRLVARTYPGGETEQRARDAAGNVVSLTDANGRTTTLTYDVMNRPTRKDYPDASSVRYAYTPDDQRASTTDARGITTYSYDTVGRLASVLHPTGETVHYTHDANGNLSSLASPAGTVSYGYDALDRLIQVNAPEGVAQAFYDLVGNRVRLVAANGILSDAVFDLRNRPTQLTHRTPSSTLIASFLNAYSPAGRRTDVTELDGSHVQYTYDAKGRLGSESRGGVSPLLTTYTYDAVGNRTQAVQNGVPTNFTYDTDDRLLSDGSTTYAWDANGNLVSRTMGITSTLYTYDAEDRLVSITGPGGVTQHAYDADGNRVSTVTPGGTTRFLVDTANNTGLSQVLEEKDGGGALQARYAYGNELLSMGRGGLASFFHSDAQGSTRTLTNAARTPTDSYTFDAFGKTVSATGTTANAYLYGGQRFDAGSGLYHLRARYYDPEVGRFLSRDPLAGEPKNPGSLHRYQYASADPVNGSDPTGQEGSLFEFSLASALDKATEQAYNFGVFVEEGCNLKERLDVIGQAVMYGSLAFSALAAFQQFTGLPGKASFTAFGINPVRVRLDSIKKIEVTVESPFNLSLKLTPHSGLVRSFSYGAKGAAFSNSVPSKPIYTFRACGIPIGDVNFKRKFGVNLSAGTATAGFSIELSTIVFKYEYPIFEAKLTEKDLGFPVLGFGGPK